MQETARVRFNNNQRPRLTQSGALEQQTVTGDFGVDQYVIRTHDAKTVMGGVKEGYNKEAD